MAVNRRYTHNKHITLPVPEGTVSGDPVVVGAYAGVAITDRDESGRATVWLDGSYDLPVAGTASPGDVVYYDDGDLSTAEGGTPFGIANDEKTDEPEGTLEVAPFGRVAPAVSSGTE